MSDYFDQLEQGMREAVRRRAHMPWYARVVRFRHRQAVLVLVGTLAIATPAVGSVTGWFGLGSPDRFPAQSPTLGSGRAVPASSQLLALRVADPHGGPPWGLRIVHTTRRATCIQLGRVEDGRIGSLGIDGAWNNDHLLHPFPNTSISDNCGTTDAAGSGFENIATGVVANANPTAGAHGPQASGCQPGDCPSASMRLVFMGLLGPDATSVTYRAPDGRLQTEKTGGNDGAYLLVFPLDARTCDLYTRGPSGGYSPCDSESLMGFSPSQIGAVKAITYRDGHVCRLGPSAKLLAAYRAYIVKLRRYVRSHPGLERRLRAGAEPALRRAAMLRFIASDHLTIADVQSINNPSCPPVGYVATKEKALTHASLSTPISVKVLPREFDEYVVRITFTARQPVTSSSSWYEDSVDNPSSCSSGGQGGEIGFGNIRAGQQIHDKLLLGNCKGTYHGIIGYMQNSGPVDENAVGGGTPGQDGSIIVGRFVFTIR